MGGLYYYVTLLGADWELVGIQGFMSGGVWGGHVEFEASAAFSDVRIGH